MPSSALFIKLYVLVGLFERPNCSTPKRPKQIWIPQVQEEGGSQTKLPAVSTTKAEMVLEVKRWDNFKKVFNVWVSGFRSVVSRSKLYLRVKVGHSGEEIVDLG